MSFFSKTHQSSLTVKGGSTAFPKPLFSWRKLAALDNLKASFHCAHLHNHSPQGTGDVPTALLGAIFSKPHQSSLTLKGGSTSHLGLLPSGEKRKPPYSVLKPLRYKVGGPSEVYASSGAAVFFVRDEPQGHRMLKGPPCWVYCLWERRDIRIEACCLGPQGDDILLMLWLQHK